MNGRQPLRASAKCLVIREVDRGAAARDVGWSVVHLRRPLALLTARTVQCDSDCVAQTRATRSQASGTETAGGEDHVPDRRRERGDALRRESHQEPFRRNSRRRSRKSSSFTQSSKCFLANRVSKHGHPASELTNRDRDHRRHLDPTTMGGPLEQAVETLRFGARVDYRADPDRCRRPIDMANPCATSAPAPRSPNGGLRR